jgi:glycerol-3-phosphate dehydrogenase
MPLLPLPRTADSTTREEIVSKLSEHDLFDIVVVGGGIHGAAVARIASKLGFSVALLEKADYAAATSSRSSKMAHGGLRYLELLDFEQVFEGIKAREEMFEHVGHVVRPAEFLIPVPRGHLFFRVKLSIGLFLYDLLVRNRQRRHRWIPRSKLNFPGFHQGRSDLMGCFVYTDGLMSDTRLVIENVLAARRAGAVCVNYCEASGAHREEDGSIRVEARDLIMQQELTVRARLVVNCAGPWASQVAQEFHGDPRPLTLSRGSHIIFSKPWTGPSLFLPIPGRARYYWIWPHPAGTMVGTTEREITDAELDPLPSRDEVEEILERLTRDVPDAGLSRENACYCFAGIRTLPRRGTSASSTVLSRKHIWTEERGVLTLLGGKYTTASWTALEGVRAAARALGKPFSVKRLSQRPDLVRLPGSFAAGEQEELTRSLELHGLAPEDIARLIGRYGKRLGDHYLAYAEGSREKIIALETMIALDTEQVETLEDLMRRRLELEYTEDHGVRFLPIIESVFKQLRPEIHFADQKNAYLERMRKIEELLGG